MNESNPASAKRKISLVIVVVFILIVGLIAGGFFLLPKKSTEIELTNVAEPLEEYQELNCEDESGDMLASVVNNTTDEDCVFAGCGEFFQ